MSNDTSTDPLKHFSDVLGRILETAAQLKNQFLQFGILVLVLFVVGQVFVPDWLDSVGRGLPYTVISLCFLAFLLGLFEPAISARLAPKEKPVTPVEVSQAAAPPPTEPTPTCPPTSPEALRACYLESLIGDCRRARLIGLDPSASDPTRGGMTLERLYVALDTKTQVEVEQKEKKRERNALSRERETRPLSALEALSQAPEQRMVLLGLPGAGKSTLVRYLALRMAQALTDRSRNLAEDLPGWTR